MRRELNRLNMFNRILLFLYSLGVMAALFVFGLVVAGWTTPVNFLRTYLANYNQRLIIGAVIAVFLIISIKFFIQSLSVANKPAQAIVRETELGQVRISVEAIENLIYRVANQINGISEIKSRVACLPEGINIFLRVILLPEVNVPQTSDEIQNKVRDYISEFAGVSVRSVKVLVDSIAAESKPGTSRRLN